MRQPFTGKSFVEIRYVSLANYYVELASELSTGMQKRKRKKKNRRRMMQHSKTKKLYL